MKFHFHVVEMENEFFLFETQVVKGQVVHALGGKL